MLFRSRIYSFRESFQCGHVININDPKDKIVQNRVSRDVLRRLFQLATEEASVELKRFSGQASGPPLPAHRRLQLPLAGHMIRAIFICRQSDGRMMRARSFGTCRCSDLVRGSYRKRLTVFLAAFSTRFTKLSPFPIHPAASDNKMLTV